MKKLLFSCAAVLVLFWSLWIGLGQVIRPGGCTAVDVFQATFAGVTATCSGLSFAVVLHGFAAALTAVLIVDLANRMFARKK